MTAVKGTANICLKMGKKCPLSKLITLALYKVKREREKKKKTLSSSSWRNKVQKAAQLQQKTYRAHMGAREEEIWQPAKTRWVRKPTSFTTKTMLWRSAILCRLFFILFYFLNKYIAKHLHLCITSCRSSRQSWCNRYFGKSAAVV